MDVGVLAGVVGAAAAVIAVPVAWYYGHRTTRPSRTRVQVRVTNMMPTYDLPNGERRVGERFVAVEAANTGDRVVTITGWGVKLPGDRRMVVTRPPDWATPVPHRLEPGSDATRFLVPADELYRLREQGIPFRRMRAYVMLADGVEVEADRGVPLA